MSWRVTREAGKGHFFAYRGDERSPARHRSIQAKLEALIRNRRDTPR